MLAASQTVQVYHIPDMFRGAEARVHACPEHPAGGDAPILHKQLLWPAAEAGGSGHGSQVQRPCQAYKLPTLSDFHIMAAWQQG